MPDTAPLAAHLSALGQKGRCHSFHAVPWPGILETAPEPFATQARALLGPGLAQVDASWNGGAVDSLFSPQGPLAEAQRRAAVAFGADATFFGTCGTTTSNHIALAALRHRGPEVLMDAAAHQSLLFAAEDSNVTLAPHHSGRRLDLPRTLNLLTQRAAQGRPFDTLVLAASGYDGHRLRLEKILPLLHRASPSTAWVIDEAWSALHAFAPPMAQTTALAVARSLRRTAPVLVTHSAHKTLAALRQGAYLHLLGGPDTLKHVRQALYRLHTTSPSWPILASLDLARAHGEAHGAAAFARAQTFRARLFANLRADPATAPHLSPRDDDPFYDLDPLVVRFHVGPQAQRRRDWLLAQHHVLVTTADDHLVIRLHLGVSEQDLCALTAALKALGSAPDAPPPEPKAHSHPPFQMALGLPSCGYVIPYPPGIPLARPGEIWTPHHASALAVEQARGVEIHHLPPRSPPMPPLTPHKTGGDQ
jgi:arginine/lysine/ornithine decarboxylase